MQSNLTLLETMILRMLIAKSVENENIDSLILAKEEQIPGEEERLKWLEDCLAKNDT